MDKRYGDLLQAASQTTVVIPVRNGEKTILRALKSIENQTVKPGRVLVVDNGSTDSTRAQIASWSGSVDVEVAHCGVLGSAAARNVGIALTETDLIAFLDADDIWYPEKLQVQLTEIPGDINEVFSGCYMHYLTPDGRVLGDNMRYRTPKDAASALREARAMPVPLSSTLVSREIVALAGGFDETFLRAQDFEWMTRLAAIHDLRVAGARPLVGYVMGSESSTDTSYIEQGLAAIEVRRSRRTLTSPDYESGVRTPLRNGRIPHRLKAGKHYRRAGVAMGRRDLRAVARSLALAVAYDPVGTFGKLRWQVLKKRSVRLDEPVRRYFGAT